MGLASHFGDQAYQCKNCGHKMALYAPACPVCQKKGLTRINAESVPGFRAGRTVNEEIRETRQPGSALVSFATVVGILTLGVCVYIMYVQPRPESMTKPEPSSNVGEETAKSQSSSAHVSNNQASKHSKRANTHPVIAKTHGVSTANLSTPKPVTPMKLWTSDDEGGNP